MSIRCCSECIWKELKLWLGNKEEAKMKLEKHDVPDFSQTSVGVMNREDRRQSVPRRPAGSRSRVQIIDGLLADIQRHIERLRLERTHLGLVRAELAGMEAKRRTA
jgi:hypothetical protein